MTDTTFPARFLDLQSRVKLSKDNFNEYGNFLYRNIEQMMDVVRPVGAELGIIFRFDDEIVVVGEGEEYRFYVKSTATATDIESALSFSSSAYAREPKEKKKMDAAQVTGTASSYARKYALSALLAIGTGQPDPDELPPDGKAEPKSEPKTEQPAQKSTKHDYTALKELTERYAKTTESKDVNEAYRALKLTYGNPEEMDEAGYKAMLLAVEQMVKEREQ